MTPAELALENAMHCEAKKHAYRQTQDGVVVSFVLHPNEVPDGLATAPLGSRYVLALVQIDESELPVKQKEAAAKPRPSAHPPTPQTGGARREKMDWRDMQPAAQAGIRCEDPVFWAFLSERYRDDWLESASDAPECVRLVCGVTSRSELGTVQAARVIWKMLDEQFQSWKLMERA